jgi:hypothetical protein
VLTKTIYMSNKTKNILKWIPSVLVALQLTVSAILKFISFPFLVQAFTEIGLVNYLAVFGCAEITLAILFLYSRTMRIGFLLITAYFGGAIATEMSHGGFIAPVVILTLVWIGAYLRKPELFRGERSNARQDSWQAKVAA